MSPDAASHGLSPVGRGTGGDARVLVEAVRRLDREFGGNVHRGVIRTVVQTSHDELDCPSTEALPELLERLARERLRQYGPGASRE